MSTTPQWETELESEINAQIDRIRLFSKQGHLEESLSDLSRFGKERIASGFASTLSLALQQERQWMVKIIEEEFFCPMCDGRGEVGNMDANGVCNLCRGTGFKDRGVFPPINVINSLAQPKKE